MDTATCHPQYLYHGISGPLTGICCNPSDGLDGPGLQEKPLRNLDELINEASQKARFLGHKLDVFDRHDSKEAYSTCLLCNGVIGVAIQPHEYGEDIFGDVLEQHCEAKRKVPRPVLVTARGLDAAEQDLMSLTHSPGRSGMIRKT